MIRFAIAAVVLAFPVTLAIQTIRGRVRLACCSPSVEASRDLRMRDAYDEDEAGIQRRQS